MANIHKLLNFPKEENPNRLSPSKKSKENLIWRNTICNFKS
jgi:hypothetical protein